MKRDYYISVAMATYNGEKYIKEQLMTILTQLNDDDEVIISDDGSNDKTLEIIQLLEDKRIKVIEGPHKGVKKNFENAISNTTGKYIFLADQDDIWINNKVEIVLEKFNSNSNISLIVHDAEVFNDDNNEIIRDSFFEFKKSKPGIIKNIWRNSYIGCCMAIKKELKEYIFPFPNDIEMHDQWIGIINEKKYNKSVFIKDKLIRYRRHSDNISVMQHYPLWKMIKNRAVLIKNFLKA